MKKLLIFILLCSPVMGQTYFGQTSGSIDGYLGVAGNAYRYSGYAFNSTVAGTITSIGVYARSAGGVAGNIRIAVYKLDDLSLVCQGDSEIVVNNTTSAWVEHTSLSGICVVDISTNYILAYAQDSNDTQVRYTTGTTGDMIYGAYDYTSGFPDTIFSSATSSTYRRWLRAGILEYTTTTTSSSTSTTSTTTSTIRRNRMLTLGVG